VYALAKCLDAVPEWRQLHDLLMNTSAPEFALFALEDAIGFLSKQDTA
jgi:hypothetical protein